MYLGNFEPVPGAFPEPVPTPPPPAGAGLGRGLQLVLWPSQTGPAPQGHFTLEPFYDPTNGTTSDGDLFIEIQKGE